jgi:hypothetical protein
VTAEWRRKTSWRAIGFRHSSALDIVSVHSKVIIAAAALLLAPAGCSRHGAESASHSKVFIPQSAHDTKVFRDGTDVVFSFDEPYPAERLRLLIDNAYRPPTWQRIDELALFPGRRTSEWPGGWSQYSQDGNQVHRWVANWKHQDGTVVTYVITYRWTESS